MEASFENIFLPCPAVSQDNPLCCACWFSTTLITDYTNSRSSISVKCTSSISKRHCVGTQGPTLEGFVKYLNDIFVFSCCRTYLKGSRGFAQLVLKLKARKDLYSLGITKTCTSPYCAQSILLPD